MNEDSRLGTHGLTYLLKPQIRRADLRGDVRVSAATPADREIHVSATLSSGRDDIIAAANREKPAVLLTAGV